MSLERSKNVTKNIGYPPVYENVHQKEWESTRKIYADQTWVEIE